MLPGFSNNQFIGNLCQSSFSGKEGILWVLRCTYFTFVPLYGIVVYIFYMNVHSSFIWISQNLDISKCSLMGVCINQFCIPMEWNRLLRNEKIWAVDTYTTLINLKTIILSEKSHPWKTLFFLFNESTCMKL